MQRFLTTVALGAAAMFAASGAFAQSGSVGKAVGGYSFEEAAKEAAGTKNFHSADGKLTFAIVTHTAGNGFFDPVYVGAQVAGNMIGAKILLLGSENPVDDPAREIEILNQIVQDPDDRRHHLHDAAGRRLQRHHQDRAEERHSDRDDELLRRRPPRSPQHQPHRAGCVGGGHRRQRAREVPHRQRHQGRLDRLPEQHGAGQYRGQQPRLLRLQRDRRRAEGSRQARCVQGRRRSGEGRHRRRSERSGRRHRLAVRVAR